MIQGAIHAGPDFKQRMADRLARWYKSAAPHRNPERQKRRLYVAGLANKSEMHRYAHDMGIPLPQAYAEEADVDRLDFTALPERIAVKPNNSADCDCVMLFTDGVEVFSGKEVPQDQRATFVRETFAKGRFITPRTTILVEEFVRDHDPAYAIPRDYKVYVAGGRAYVILVVDRNHPRGQWTQSFYSRDWTPMGDIFQTSLPQGPVTPPPPRLSELLALAERIAADIGCFMRLDFYISPERVIFGEFAPYPDAGGDYTPFADRMLCTLMDAFPDEF